MIMNKAEQIWGAYMQSMQQQNDNWKNLLAEDVTFTGPAAKAVGKEEDLTFLEELSQCLAKASLCDLGKSAPNSVLSTLRHFRDEYLTHINKEVCPTKRCTM